MRVHDDFAEGWNVEQQSKQEGSVLKFWQKMLALRKQYEALVYGEYTDHLYTRRLR
jgi:alpha-glucosidase